MLATATAMLLGPGATSALGSSVEPPTYTNTLPAGANVTIKKIVHTPAVPTNPDVVFMSDTTGSMGATIANVKGNIADIMKKVNEGQPAGATAQFAAADYKDGRPSAPEEEGCESDPYPFKVGQALTESTTEVQTAVNGWEALGGCDRPESQVNALYQVGSGAIGFRSNSTRVLVWFGDAPGHDPDLGHTLEEAIAALKGAHVRVIAVPVKDEEEGLDATGQATKVAEETGGEVLPEATPEEVATRILEGLENLPVTVTPVPACDPGLTATYDEASKTVTSGSDATFEETLSVEPAVAVGTVLHCEVDFQLNGVSQPGFQQTVEITVGCTAARGVGHAGPRNFEGLNEDNNLNTNLTEKQTFEFTLPFKVAHFHLSHLTRAVCEILPGGGRLFSGVGTGKLNRHAGYDVTFSIEQTGGRIYLTARVEKEGALVLNINHLLLNKGSKEHYS